MFPLSYEAVLKAHTSTTPAVWNANQNGTPDYVATYHGVGNNPDKHWIAIDTHKYPA